VILHRVSPDQARPNQVSLNQAAPTPIGGAAEIFNEEARLSAELSYVDLSPEWRDELLDPEGWNRVLQTFAGTMKLAVALTDPEGRLLGKCHNPQPTWRMARAARPAADLGCPFCLPPPIFCGAAAEALRTGGVVIVEDGAGLAHVAVPLSLGGQQLGLLLAGQVFSRYPEPLRLHRVARELGIAEQQLWHQATLQVPVTCTTLKLYGHLLMALGQAFLGQRYAAILQHKLAQTSQRYRLFFDGVKDYALYTVDGAGRITTWNSAAERLFGYREEEIMGQYASRLVGPEELHREALQQALLEADRLGWVEREGWRVRQDGTRFLASGVLAVMGEGASHEYGILVRDVTELRRTAQDLQQAQKMEGVGVLAGGIAHDFNNLLTGIMGGLSLVKSSLPVDDATYPMVELAEQSSMRAAELVAQLLAYAGKGKFIVTRFDFSALVAEMLPLITASIPRTVRLELLLPPGLPWIEADASQIRQIVMNLVINGAEAIGPEGGTVRVSSGVPESGTDVFMEVKDSGSGMSEATQAKMFDPFFTTKFTGRGLGLAAVSGIVRGHKGKMKVDSIPGQGTTFTVSFPAVPAEPPKPVSAPKLVTIPRGTGTILVVDDEPALRKMAGMILENSGYSVLAAMDGREAVAVFRQNAAEIAAVLLDMTMPVMGGHEAFSLIREIHPGVPIIMSSGYSETFAREELGQDAEAGFVQKPYTAATLVKSIQEALAVPHTCIGPPEEVAPGGPNRG
jgi:PAS domain S-box-containing protein